MRFSHRSQSEAIPHVIAAKTVGYVAQINWPEFDSDVSTGAYSPDLTADQGRTGGHSDGTSRGDKHRDGGWTAGRVRPPAPCLGSWYQPRRHRGAPARARNSRMAGRPAASTRR